MKRLEGWKGSVLSFGGILVLINSCLSSIPTYCMSMYLLPKIVFKNMDRTRKKGSFGREGEKRKNII
jgi:hypothetical protein